MTAERADVHLVSTGAARSRNQAQRWIREGRVRCGSDAVARPSQPVPAGSVLTVDAAPQDPVGRGALKLQAAIDSWGPRGLVVAGRRCLDVGASTGGFTQVLLQEGAAHVTALDVGHGQLVPELAADPRVRDLPGTNVRTVAVEDIGRFELGVVDVSFISLRLVLPAVARVVTGDVVALVKPQFEVGRDGLGRGGVVRDTALREQGVLEVLQSSVDMGLHPVDLRLSPVRGTHGNVEYLVWLRPGSPAGTDHHPDRLSARIRALSRQVHE